MANSMRLSMTFKCADGKEHSFGWNNSLELPRETDVRTLASAMITNGSIFENVPVEVISAKVVVTNEQVIDVTD